MDQFKPHPRWLREVFFWSGIIATLAYRIIVIVNNYSAFWSEVCWYVGTIGFIIYFAHRYQISEKRAKLIHDYNLDGKVAQNSPLTEEERAAMHYIFTTLVSSKEKVNSIFLFIVSGLALVIAIYLDFFANR